MYPLDVNVPKEMKDSLAIVERCRGITNVIPVVTWDRKAEIVRKRRDSNFSKVGSWRLPIYGAGWFKLFAHAERKIRLGSRWTRN